jgi:predicted transcriptional regulator
VPTTALDVQEKQDEQARLAYEMRQDGKSWYSIAKALGLTESAASQSVSRAMEQAAGYVSEQAKRNLLALEVTRLDRLQEVVWPQAMQGNLRAMDMALRIIMARAKVQQLDVIPDTSITNNTLVVTGSSEEYVAALRAIAGVGQ